MSLIVKVHHKDSRTVVAVCDSDLVGRVFEENNVVLDLSGDFFNGEVLEKQEVGDLIRNADSVNLVGKEAVKLGISEGIIEEENIKVVDGVPHAQAVILQE
ncbi:DUF424 domain-containing protein [Candidatus Woesearchaeota archaeon]|nr:MAG: DUF424 domain-containing protein [Candidatus Woesearchaeota archaeon]